MLGGRGTNGEEKTRLVRASAGATGGEGRGRGVERARGAVEAGRVGVLRQRFDTPARLTARELVDYDGGLYDDARDTESASTDSVSRASS